MAGPVLLMQAILLLGFILFLLLLLYVILTKRKQLQVSLPLTVLFLALITPAVLFYRSCKTGEEKAAKKFLGDYKLEKLDGEVCEHCLIRLTIDYQYKILKNDEVIGQGKWWLESAPDIPGLFLRLENGPGYVIWPDDRIIHAMDRRHQ
ncbi:hypothetical protein [Chitinophaga qingshengii]|uniref:Uncharacterized protein n=1 Tax=Chitinophaga qingshengii TaxID=1569794 RepID=A0ABR7TNL2_9BACT|nr:hypothetical protein [Chitinophaga qingshengii]MBC9931019.1 hypothetical protein [Chitinophaga qingshengii]